MKTKNITLTILFFIIYNSIYSLDGVRIGSGISFLAGSTNKLEYSFLPKESFCFSIFNQIKLNDKYFLNYELSYINKGGIIKSDYGTYEINYKYNLNYIAFPFFINKKLKKNNYLTLGLIPGFSIHSRISKIMNGNYPSNIPKKEINKSVSYDELSMSFMPDDYYFGLPFETVYNKATLSQSVGMSHKLSNKLMLMWYASFDYIKTIDAIKYYTIQNNSIISIRSDFLKARNLNFQVSLLYFLKN